MGKIGCGRQYLFLSITLCSLSSSSEQLRLKVLFLPLMFRFLIIQTAFTGDVVLATAVAEKLHACYPDADIDFLLRKGNEGLLRDHPFIRHVLVWNKQQHKNRNLIQIIHRVRTAGYTHVINLHRFATSGIITCLSGAANKAGFDKNPFSFCYNKKIKHYIEAPGTSHPIHETARNQQLITDITDDRPALPALYPTPAAYAEIAPLQQQAYICMAPASVWFTKQFPEDKWVSLIDYIGTTYPVYLIGGPGDQSLANNIIRQCKHDRVISLCGKLDYLASAALMQGAEMNYVNDSAPLHFATAMHAPVTAIFCSTVPAFGFGPLRDNGRVVETTIPLSCRPCGLHGHRACPEGHFACAYTITNEQLTAWISNRI